MPLQKPRNLQFYFRRAGRKTSARFLRASSLKVFKLKFFAETQIVIISNPVGDALWDCRCSFFFFFSFFSATILSGPYLWNRYSQRLQIECAAWSCGIILHCCLPSNSLRYFFFFFFFPRHEFVRAISLEPLLAETPN